LLLQFYKNREAYEFLILSKRGAVAKTSTIYQFHCFALYLTKPFQKEGYVDPQTILSHKEEKDGIMHNSLCNALGRQNEFISS